MDPYKNISNHSVEVTGGRPLAPGEVADIDPDEPEMVSAIEEGQLEHMPDEAVAAHEQAQHDQEAAEQAERERIAAEAAAAEQEQTSTSKKDGDKK